MRGEGVGPRVSYTRGPDGDVQVLWKEFTAADRYVADRAWDQAVLGECPFHPHGGCGLRKLGTYGRVQPEGVRVARFWCPAARTSISLLPAFLAARMVGTVDEVEATVLAVEQAGSVAAAVERVYPSSAARAIGLACAMRAIRRRLHAVRATLLAFVTLRAEHTLDLEASIGALRKALGTERVLMTVRCFMAQHLAVLPTPLGFRQRVRA